MSNNAKLKYTAIFAAAVLVPPLVMAYVDPSGILPASLLASVAIAVLLSSAPVILSVLVPVGVYGLGCILSGDFVLAAMPLVFFPAGFCAGICMRKGCTRRFAVSLTSVGLVLGLGAEFVFLTYYLCGGLSTQDFRVCYNSLYLYFVNYIYNSVYNVLNANAENYGLNDVDISVYTIAYIRSFRPMLFGTVILVCNIVSYIFTAASKNLLRFMNIDKYKDLPGIRGDWEFVLSKSSAMVFIISYVCLLLGGDTLTLPQASAFYAVMLAIAGGVFLMAFRAVRNKFSMGGGSNFIIIGILLLLFLQGSLMDIVMVILAVIGLSATFKQGVKEGEKQ